MSASLQAVVGTYSALVQEGNSWRADCPECAANRLIVTDALLCLECGWKGDALAYLMLVEGCTEDEARARLANGEFTEPPPEPLRKRPRLELVGSFEQPDVDVSQWFAYRDANGAVLAYTDGQAWRTHGRLGPNDPPQWYKRRPEPPRPLYGLDRLHIAKRVIVCESEREADACQRLFPLNPCVAWACGQHAHAGAHCTPIAGRAVLLVPRND